MGSSFQIAVGPDVRASSRSADGVITILIKSLSLLQVSHPDNKDFLKVFVNPNILYFTDPHNMKEKNNILKHLIESVPKILM